MATSPAFYIKTTLGFQRDTGVAISYVNDTTETSYVATNGYQMGTELVLDVGDTNTAVTLTSDIAWLLVEELTGKGVTVKIGSTSATAIASDRVLLQGIDGESVMIASGTSIYLTNAGANQIRVRVSWGGTVA